MPRLTFSAIGDALNDLPGPAKLVGAVLGALPIVWAVVGIGWAGYTTPSRLDRHIAQMDTVRSDLRVSNAAQAGRDSAMIDELREGNRLLRCSLTESGDLARARCAARR